MGAVRGSLPVQASGGPDERARALGEGQGVESILWAMDLLAVVYLCRWALKNDRRDPGEQ
ncbi:hypothetical protein RC55_15810 [Herbaspirillum seropedicae]|nr:hypothetical protein ACP92_13865 [Herbaspirillum seropedicae]NQE30706.1 hypothetical protein [Herbaspirillum seropedicae]